MNTELKRLHDEAVIYTVSLCGQDHTDGPRAFQEVLDEKFAELIVRECEQVSLKNSHRNDDMGAIIARQIVDHFGVKE